jgi:SAM-dependent methyltransferase
MELAMPDVRPTSAVERYEERVDAVLAQRTRLRGPQPPGDLFAGLRPDAPLLNVDPHKPLSENVAIIASYVEADDVIVDVGGGAGRISLPLALRCREVINVDPSAAMGAAFLANAAKADIKNARFVHGDWLDVEPPTGTVALVNHVTYFARDIRPFIERLERAGGRRVVITVTDPPPPSMLGVLYQLVHGETEECVPGHVELANVLWEMGILPDIRVLPAAHTVQPPPSPSREAAVGAAIARFPGSQWSFWPLEPTLAQRLYETVDRHFDELFVESSEGFEPLWQRSGREILITWRPDSDRETN